MSKEIKIGLLGLGHLLVDLQGLYLIHYMSNNLDFTYISIYFVIYNFIAFGLQPVFGYLADRKNLYFLYIILGLLLPAIAINFSTIGVIAIIVSTIGNAMYHVGGGVISINLYPNKAAPAGIFVAPGAIGVFLGVQLALLDNSYALLISIVALVIVILLYLTFKNQLPDNRYSPVKNQLGKLTILILLIVLIRGFVGMSIIYPWKTNLYLSAFLVLGVFIGKFCGGILGDRLGYKKIGISGLVLSLPFILAGYYVSVIGIIGALLFNLTMAITLYYIIYSFGKYKGFAFGLTTLALFISYLPNILGLSFEYNLVYYIVLIVLVGLAVY
ncbi:MAG: hypothetical protein PQJ44_10110, partial [Sphaerochaetaceae bacterium]|nr:hypothetical protein [Sphaerochaetaceae bacterium]